MFDFLKDKPNAPNLDLENNQLIKEAKNIILGNLSQKTFEDLNKILKIVHTLQFKDQSIFDELKNFIFIKYPKFEDIDVKYIVETFIIFLNRYELSEEQIEIFKNMLGKMSLRIKIEQNIQLTEIMLEKNLIKIRDFFYEYHLFQNCWKKMHLMDLGQFNRYLKTLIKMQYHLEDPSFYTEYVYKVALALADKSLDLVQLR